MRYVLSAFVAMLATSVLCAGDVGVSKIFSRATKGKNGAVFFTLENTSSRAIKLIAAESDVSDEVELHDHIKEGDIFRMRQVPYIVVPENGTAILKPSSLHVMLLGLKTPLDEGSVFNMTLVFDNDERHVITVPIGTPGQMSGCCGECNKGKKS